MAPMVKNKPALSSAPSLTGLKSEVKAYRNLLDALFEIEEVGIALVSPMGNIVKINKGLSLLLGYPNKVLVGQPFSKIIEFRKPREASSQQAPLESGEYRIVSRNGQIIDVVITNTPYTDQQGQVGTIKTIRNISREKELNEMVRGASSSLNIGGIEYNQLTREITWTEATARILEISPRTKPTLAMLGRYVAFRERVKIHATVSHLQSTLSDVEVEFCVSTRTRKTRWIHLRLHPILIKRKLAGIRGTVLDITRSRLAALEIERLSWVARHTRSAVIIADKRDRIEWVNDSFTRLMGYDLDSVIGKVPGLVLRGPLTDKKELRRIMDHVRDAKPVSGILQLYTKESKPIWFNLDIAPIQMEGEAHYFVGILTDLTELIRSQEFQKNQEALEQRQKLLQAIASNFPGGLIGVLNKNLQYVFVGGSEIKKLGHTTQDWVGHALFDKVSPEANAFAAPFLNRVFQGESVQFETRVKDNNYLISAVPMAAEAKYITRALVVIQNITERKQAEEETLRALSKQRELSELKSKFVTIASHEFRTPLGTILSSADLAHQYHLLSDNENTAKHINRVKSSVKQLTEILNEFLQLGKIEEGVFQSTPTAFELSECCEALVEEMSAIKKQGQEIIYRCEGLQDNVVLDRQHTKNILVNLLSNAIKYSPPGKRIWFTTTVEKDSVVFEVKDEGIGIAEEDKSQVYDAFFRAHNAAHIQGTGLGLNIVQRYLKLMDGTISMKSELNKGSTFTVRIPKAQPIKFA
jgi:PAS domain S-box-containing protein